MFGETTISYVKIGNHPIETAIYKWLFGVPGAWYMFTYIYQNKNLLNEGKYTVRPMISVMGRVSTVLSSGSVGGHVSFRKPRTFFKILPPPEV